MNGIEMLQAKRNSILVEPYSMYGRTSSGIYTAGHRKELPVKGRVTSSGHDRVEVNDTVYLRKYHWKMFVWERQRLLSVKYADLLGIERDGQIRAIGDSVIVKITYQKKAGLIYIPPSRQTIRAGINAEVVAIGPDYKNGLSIGEEVVILRVEDTVHEGIEIETSQGKLWRINSRWVMATKGE